MQSLVISMGPETMKGQQTEKNRMPIQNNTLHVKGDPSSLTPRHILQGNRKGVKPDTTVSSNMNTGRLAVKYSMFAEDSIHCLKFKHQLDPPHPFSKDRKEERSKSIE